MREKAAAWRKTLGKKDKEENGDDDEEEDDASEETGSGSGEESTEKRDYAKARKFHRTWGLDYIFCFILMHF